MLAQLRRPSPPSSLDTVSSSWNVDFNPTGTTHNGTSWSNNTNQGGKFQWTNASPLDSFVNDVVSGEHVLGGANFISFCIELTEHMSQNTTYTVDVETDL